MEEMEQGLKLIEATASKDKLHGCFAMLGKSDKSRHQGLDAYGDKEEMQ